MRIVAAMLLLATTAVAHHSSAMYDFKTPLTFEGSVKEWKWTNPHAFLHVLTPGADGRPPVEWMIEFGSPNSLFREGMRPGSFTPGDRISVTLVPLRDGTPGGQIRSVTLADGSVRTFASVAR